MTSSWCANCSFTCPGVPFFSQSYVLVSYRFSLSSVLVSSLVYFLPWCPTDISSVLASTLFFCHPSCCPLCFPGIPSADWASCPDVHMFRLLPFWSPHSFLYHLLPCFVCSRYHLSLSPLSFLSSLTGVYCSWTTSYNETRKTYKQTKIKRKTNKIHLKEKRKTVKEERKNLKLILSLGTKIVSAELSVLNCVAYSFATSN